MISQHPEFKVAAPTHPNGEYHSDYHEFKTEYFYEDLAFPTWWNLAWPEVEEGDLERLFYPVRKPRHFYGYPTGMESLFFSAMSDIFNRGS